MWGPQRTSPSPADAMAGSVSAVVSASPGGAAKAGEAPAAARTPARPRAKRLKRLHDDEKAALASHFLATRWVASRPSVAVAVDAAALAQAAGCTVTQAAYWAATLPPLDKAQRRGKNAMARLTEEFEKWVPASAGDTAPSQEALRRLLWMDSIVPATVVKHWKGRSRRRTRRRKGRARAGAGVGAGVRARARVRPWTGSKLRSSAFWWPA